MKWLSFTHINDIIHMLYLLEVMFVHSYVIDSRYCLDTHIFIVESR